MIPMFRIRSVLSIRTFTLSAAFFPLVAISSLHLVVLVLFVLCFCFVLFYIKYLKKQVEEKEEAKKRKNARVV